ncbi:MAG: MurR/RpiR family transcriptional regulator [Longibaculum sp.]
MNALGMYLRAMLRQEKYGSTNYRIAEYLLNHANIEKLSTQLLSEACHVSKSSISRFCKAIGVEDFSELKFLAKQKGYSYKKKFYFDRHTDNEMIDYMDYVSLKIKEMEEHLNYQLVDQLVHDIRKYQKIVLMGISHTINPASYLQQDLSVLHKAVYCTDNVNEQKEILMSSGEETLIIVFSGSGAFFERVLPRDRVMEREHIPCIYQITCQPIEPASYIKDLIVLNQKVDYTSQLLMNLLAHLIIVRYKTLYGVS